MANQLPLYNLLSFDYIRRAHWTRESFDSRTPLGAAHENLVTCATEAFGAIPRQPVLLKCGDCMCWECYMKLEGTSCPRCRHPIDEGDVRQLAQFTAQETRLISAFTDVDCHNACGFHGPSTRTVEHEKVFCPLRDVKCPNKGCLTVGMARDIVGQHLAACPWAREACRQCRLPRLSVPNPNHPHDCTVEALLHIHGKNLVF